MLTPEDNDLLNRVGPGWPINTYFKHFWLPALPSRHLEADGIPVKVRLLGENYVLFRDREGKAGCLDEACPHRGISLALARNENSALTCIFHGWSFNAKGECIATPTELNKDFCKKVRVRSYPIHEAGGAIWVWLAPGAPARFPDFPFACLPEEQTFARRGLTYSNWSQNMEALLDISHLSVLHKSFASMAESLKQIEGSLGKYTIETTDYGFRSYWFQARADGAQYVRVDECLGPHTAMPASAEDEVATMVMFVPIDDATTYFWVFLWEMDKAIDGGGGLTKGAYDDFDWQSKIVDRSRRNFGQDREAMRRGHWTGAPNFAAEDLMVLESMPIIDRTKEQLCSSDVGVVRHRRDLLRNLRAIRDGRWTGRPDDSGVKYRGIRPLAFTLSAGGDAQAYVAQKRAAFQARLGEPRAAAAE